MTCGNLPSLGIVPTVNTAKHLLLDTLLGPKIDLDQWVQDHRDKGLTWLEISRLLTKTTGHDVGREWLRSRYANQETVAS